MWISCTGHQVTTPRLLFHTVCSFFEGVGKTRNSIHHDRCGGLGSTNTNSVRVFWNGTKSSKDTVRLPVYVLDYMMNARSRILELCVLTKMIVSACTIDSRQINHIHTEVEHACHLRINIPGWKTVPEVRACHACSTGIKQTDRGEIGGGSR